MNNEVPLGIYDSGLGGLTVWRKIREQLPNECMIYYGDTAHLPYGGKPAREILQYSRQICDFLVSQGVKLVIAACNTSSALALPYMKHVPIPLIGMIEPSIHEAVRTSKNGKIGLMATEGTVLSKAHAQKLKQLAPQFDLVAQACPRLVPLIEAGHRCDAELIKTIAQYTKPLLDAQVDCIILGCTHYPLVAPVIQAIVGNIALIDPAGAVANQVGGILDQRGERNTHSGGRDRFYVSGDPDAFAQAASSLSFQLNGKVQKNEQPFHGSEPG